MPHAHVWILISTATNRYRCACGVIGHKASNLPGQYRATTKYVQPFRCQHRTGRTYCSAEAVFVCGEQRRNRCAEHLEGTHDRTNP